MGLKVLSASVALFILSAPGIATACHLKSSMRTNPPYFFSSGAGGALTGIYFDIVTSVSRRLGCTVSFVELPTPRALIELEEGRLDLVPGTAQTAARERFAHFAGPLERHPNALYVSQEAFKKYSLRRLEDIKGTDFRLGFQHSLSYGIEYEALKNDPEFAARLAPIATQLGAWKMMAANRLDGYIADDESGLDEIRDAGLAGRIRKANVALQPTPSFIALGKKSLSAEFRARFDGAMAEMTRSGELARIVQRHGRCPSVGSTKRCN